VGVGNLWDSWIGADAMNDQAQIEEKALKKSMIGAFILAIWGIAMAAVASSGAIMLDGMFNFILEAA